MGVVAGAPPHPPPAPPPPPHPTTPTPPHPPPPPSPPPPPPRPPPAEIAPPPLDAVLDGRRRGHFSESYVSDLFTTSRDVDAFASMIQEPEGAAARLERAILYAESSQYIGDELSGRRWINAVNAVTDPLFAELAPDTSRPLTFTSGRGRIPLRMG